jgi:hypothetical protein
VFRQFPPRDHLLPPIRPIFFDPDAWGGPVSDSLDSNRSSDESVDLSLLPAAFCRPKNAPNEGEDSHDCQCDRQAIAKRAVHLLRLGHNLQAVHYAHGLKVIKAESSFLNIAGLKDLKADFLIRNMADPSSNPVGLHPSSKPHFDQGASWNGGRQVL